MLEGSNTQNTKNLTNEGIPLAVCTRVFSLLKYYLDKYNVEAISYQTASDPVGRNGNVRETRKTIYDRYFEKNFPEYKKEDTPEKDQKHLTNTVWHRV